MNARRRWYPERSNGDGGVTWMWGRRSGWRTLGVCGLWLAFIESAGDAPEAAGIVGKVANGAGNSLEAIQGSRIEAQGDLPTVRPILHGPLRMVYYPRPPTPRALEELRNRPMEFRRQKRASWRDVASESWLTASYMIRETIVADCESLFTPRPAPTTEPRLRHYPSRLGRGIGDSNGTKPLTDL